MNKLWETESEMALRAVSIAGERSLERPEQLNFTAKESHRDIVTEMDTLLEDLIRTNLSNSTYPIVGEEKGGTLNLKSDSPTWIVDPLDGTANFANRIPYYAISVGLLHKNEFVLGAVASPATKELYFNHGRESAYLNGKKLQVSKNVIQQSLTAMSFSGKTHDQRNLEYEVFREINEKTRGVLRTGSAALNICYVSSERLQAAFGFSNKVWDIAGAIPIAVSAGAIARVEFIDATTCRYLVAAPGVFEPLNEMFSNKGLF